MTIQPQTVVGGVAAVSLVTAGGFATWHYLLNKPYGDYYLYAISIGREYLSDFRENIKAMFVENSDFRQYLGANFDEMKKVSGVYYGDLSATDVQKDSSQTFKLDEFTDYVYRWCEYIAREKVEGAKKSDGTWDTSKFSDSGSSKWKAFKEQCTDKKRQD
ncbi:hypothetical protein [Candidatus Mycoplasma haematohominis]|uniref:hypothetical protein n=1 Tax=Candidatus Mycoplasma haematohominis TaxID=1494318 RepID=UPI001C0A741C|nr:hypothetical protein [Candidatus Mycoplasma haemohominis]